MRASLAVISFVVIATVAVLLAVDGDPVKVCLNKAPSSFSLANLSLSLRHAPLHLPYPAISPSPTCSHFYWWSSLVGHDLDGGDLEDAS
jgi:hypothetical protein